MARHNRPGGDSHRGGFGGSIHHLLGLGPEERREALTSGLASEPAEWRAMSKERKVTPQGVAEFLGRWVMAGPTRDLLQTATGRLRQSVPGFWSPKYPLGAMYLARDELCLPGRQTEPRNHNVHAVRGIHDAQSRLVQECPSMMRPITVFGWLSVFVQTWGNHRSLAVGLRLSADPSSYEPPAAIVEECGFASTYYDASYRLQKGEQAPQLSQVHLVLGRAIRAVKELPEPQPLLDAPLPIVLGPVEAMTVKL